MLYTISQTFGESPIKFIKQLDFMHQRLEILKSFYSFITQLMDSVVCNRTRLMGGH